jgi:molybdopterin-synthase adenylyltransferase
LRESDTGRNKAEAVAERARRLDPHVTVRAVPGDVWNTMSLGRLREYDCAIAAVDNFEARLRLNQLCLIARVNLVNAGLDSRWAAVESFPFATSDDPACYECTLPGSAYERVAERYSCGGLRRRAGQPRLVPTTVVTASVAGALAASMALRLGGEDPQRAQRRLLDTIGGTGSAVEIERREGCPGCGTFTRPPRIVRTRNRWSVRRDGRGIDGTDAGAQVMHLSDPLITGYECAACGTLEEAARYVNQRAAEFDDAIATCPKCDAPAVRIEIRDTFTVGELTARFPGQPVPAKFALAEINGEAVCFDLEENTGK